MCSWKRARKPEQMEVRRQQILDAALELFLGSDYNNVSLNQIARRAGMAKSNIYNYFQTREEIYLVLMQELMIRWGESVIESLLARPANGITDLVERFIDPVAAPKEFLALTSVLNSSLEQNSSEESIVQFKEATLQITGRIVEAIQRSLPWFTAERGSELLMVMHALTAGIYSASQPSPTLERVLQRPEYSPMKVEFRKTMIATMTRILRDMEREADR